MVLTANSEGPISDLSIAVFMGEARFVKHVAIVDYYDPHRERVYIKHMRPPFEPDAMVPRQRVPAFCSMELSEDDIAEIRLFISQMEQPLREFARIRNDPVLLTQYCVIPHFCLNPQFGFRGSCAGFVHEAYRAAGIVLVDVSSSLPLIEYETLDAIYGIGLCSADDLAGIGLSGDGPWRVLLPGFLVNSMLRPDHDIRRTAFVPSSDHARLS